MPPQKQNNYNMKRVLLSIAFPLLCLGITAQANYDYSRLCMEKLDRGVVAVRQPDGKVFVSWRILRDDAYQGFDGHLCEYCHDDLFG